MRNDKRFRIRPKTAPQFLSASALQAANYVLLYLKNTKLLFLLDSHEVWYSVVFGYNTTVVSLRQYTPPARPVSVPNLQNEVFIFMYINVFIYYSLSYLFITLI